MPVGRTLLALVAVTTSIGGYIADWNETHIHNPRWPPHAKFHNGQTLSMHVSVVSGGLLLGLSALYYLFRKPSSLAVERESLHTATLLSSLYWVTQLSAVLYPGSLAVDPEFGDGFPQAYLCAGLLSMVTAGTVLEQRRITAEEKRVEKRE